MMKRVVLAAMASMAVPLAAHAAGEEFARALDQRYRAVEAAIEARDGARWYEEMYTADTVVTGEGTKEVLRGRAALLPVVMDIAKSTRSCAIKPDGARQASAGLGYSFATYRCSPADTSAADYEVRALFVWKKTRAGWRVVAESYTMGSM
ncbi:nuclear transport factor 2 family protein [Aromatoleum petrolei]|uniref:DUF4440 domain-containing protein n=1 Tax=Aromatoleum petrolei TaxID=76116 RepID=A0ABX1MW83_9RHOO|nr:nuclear transport factor 2 family protein [Aromatoleum petrolei]NMF90838.1 DUF4440 domain-containing protein [Aromatoleum petrolei]QTQ34577.1 SnoaL-like domain-containing protein [Aromatoleum petrolei]